VAAFAWIVLLIGFASASSRAAAIEDCTGLSARLARLDQSNPTGYARVDAFSKVVAVLDRDDFDDCDPRLIGRARYDYATALEGYAKGFPEDSQPRREWSKKAAEAFTRYLDWFQTLGSERVDTAIRKLKGAEGLSEEAFAEIRRRFLRERIGNAINSMSQSHLGARDHAAFFASLEAHIELPVEAFPKQVVEEWYKWLRSQPDFRFLRESDQEVATAIQSQESCRTRWRLFSTFLGRYAAQSDFHRAAWDSVQERITRWLGT
jgi:hypothetical protein